MNDFILKKISQLILFTTILIIYMMPLQIGVYLDYIFISLLVLFTITYYYNSNKITVKEFLLDLTIIIITVMFVLIKKSFSSTQLLGIIVLIKMIKLDLIKYNLDKNIFKYTVILSFIAMLIYSLIEIFFFNNGRYVMVGIGEINMASYAVLLLSILFLRISKKISLLIFILGFFTLSRNYLVAVIIILIISMFKNKRYLLKFKNIFLVGLISSIILVIIGIVFEKLYLTNNLVDYQTGFKRFLYFNDYSNYFRFSTNNKVILFYLNNPEKLLTGISNQLFLEWSFEYSTSKGLLYRANIPHNYFFSYIQIYGIFSLIIFYGINKIFSKIINKNNILIFIGILMYVIFLGIGFTSYWLILTVIVLESFSYYKETSFKRGVVE